MTYWLGIHATDKYATANMKHSSATPVLKAVEKRDSIFRAELWMAMKCFVACCNCISTLFFVLFCYNYSVLNYRFYCAERQTG